MFDEQKKRDFCAMMLSRYGVAIDVHNELLPIYYVAYRSAIISEQTSLSTRESLTKIMNDFEKRTGDKIGKLETKQIRFNSSKEAFWYSFGSLGIGITIISVILFSAWFVNQHTEMGKYETQQMKNFLQASQFHPQKLDKRNTAYVVRLYPVSNLQQAEAGKNYIYNKGCECIEVPIYYEMIK